MIDLFDDFYPFHIYLFYLSPYKHFIEFQDERNKKVLSIYVHKDVTGEIIQDFYQSLFLNKLEYIKKMGWIIDFSVENIILEILPSSDQFTAQRYENLERNLVKIYPDNYKPISINYSSKGCFVLNFIRFGLVGIVLSAIVETLIGNWLGK